MYRYNYVSQPPVSNSRLSAEPNYTASRVLYAYTEEPTGRRYSYREEPTGIRYAAKERVADKSRYHDESYDADDAQNTCEGGNCQYTCEGGRCRYTCEVGNCLFNHYQPDVRVCHGDNCSIEDYPTSTCQNGRCTKPRVVYR